MHQHRVVFSYLNDKAAVKELFTVVAPKIASRPGGYTRIIKLGIRPGDNAEMAMIELVDFNEIYGKGVSKTEPAKKTRRGRATAKKLMLLLLKRLHLLLKKLHQKKSPQNKHEGLKIIEAKPITGFAFFPLIKRLHVRKLMLTFRNHIFLQPKEN